jgi:hypothetical protein
MGEKISQFLASEGIVQKAQNPDTILVTGTHSAPFTVRVVTKALSCYKTHQERIYSRGL